MQETEIHVKGRIDDEWVEWFGGLRITHTPNNDTLLRGEVLDQAELYGILAKLRDLGLALVSVRQVACDCSPGNT